MRKKTQERDEHFHAQMLKGLMPWGWAEQVSRNTTYWGWRARTQEMLWIGDDPANRAKFCVDLRMGFMHENQSKSDVNSCLSSARRPDLRWLWTYRH